MTSLQDAALWLPFTANRAFKENPRIFTSANGHYYTNQDGKKLLDCFSGLWTTGLGHCHPNIVKAIQTQVATLDYNLSFQACNDQALLLAEKLAQLAPHNLNKVFFTNSGSESVDSALKIALAYHRARHEGQRTRLIGRERGYHGVNFGGMSVGGINANRKSFSANLIPGVDHLPHTHNLAHMAFSKGQPTWGAHLAEELERLVNLHDASTIAAVIIEPVAGSTGILVPPIGYLEKIREICTKHGILLIFDEVITAFGRVGHPFASQRFNVTPDIITTAKGLTNGVIPMGAVLVHNNIYQTIMQHTSNPQTIELFHGYTYSGHPVAAAAGLATLNTYTEENSFANAQALESRFGDMLHAFISSPHVIDIRNIGLMGAIELSPRKDGIGARGWEVFLSMFEAGIVIRHSGDTLQFAPFFDMTEAELSHILTTLSKILNQLQ